MTPAVALLAMGLLGLAEDDRVWFVLLKGDGADRCADEGAIRERVTQRIGSEPFAADVARARRQLRAGLTRVDAGTVEARVAIFGADGTPLGRRMLRGPPDCSTLSDELVLAIAIAIDPLLLMRPPPPADTAVPVDEPPAIAEPAAGVAGAAAPHTPQAEEPAASAGLSLPTPEALRGRVVAGAAGGLGPAVVPSLRVGVGLDFGAVSSELSLRLNLPARVPVADGAYIDLTLLALEAGPCVEGGIDPAGLRACAMLQVGALAAQATGFSSTVATTTPWIALGARGAAVLHALPGAALVVEGELAAPLVRARFVDGGTRQTLGEAAPLVGGLSAGVELELR